MDFIWNAVLKIVGVTFVVVGVIFVFTSADIALKVVGVVLVITGLLALFPGRAADIFRGVFNSL